MATILMASLVASRRWMRGNEYSMRVSSAGASQDTFAGGGTACSARAGATVIAATPSARPRHRRSCLGVIVASAFACTHIIGLLPAANHSRQRTRHGHEKSERRVPQPEQSMLVGRPRPFLVQHRLALSLTPIPTNR